MKSSYFHLSCTDENVKQMLINTELDKMSFSPLFLGK